MVAKSTVVRDCMSRKVVSFDIKDDVGDVVAVLLEHKITGAPVLDENKNVIGFISEQDCIKEMLNTAFYCDLTANAGDVMKTEVLTVDPDMGISELADQLTTNKPKVYPVVEEGKLVGIISRSDVLQALYDASVRCHHLTDKKTAI
ncbi:MAG: CBS domain-containing protein [Pseudomonadales bacterium]|nr:CBS domain-containing protein [Pseudomonadales bacterium]RLT97949.1 MAG: CBS domain-containing protein [Ketobacter sp.]